MSSDTTLWLVFMYRNVRYLVIIFSSSNGVTFGVKFKPLGARDLPVLVESRGAQSCCWPCWVALALFGKILLRNLQHPQFLFYISLTLSTTTILANAPNSFS